MLCLGQDICGTGVPLPDFHGYICSFWGTHLICLIFTHLIERISGSFHSFLHNFVLDFDSFGSRMGVYVRAVVSAIDVYINLPASFLFLY